MNDSIKDLINVLELKLQYLNETSHFMTTKQRMALMDIQDDYKLLKEKILDG